MNTNELSAERLAEIEARANAATEGFWEATEIRWDRHYVIAKDRVIAECNGPDNAQKANCDFIAYAREDVPLLVGAVKQLQARVAGLEGQIKDYREQIAPLASGELLD